MKQLRQLLFLQGKTKGRYAPPLRRRLPSGVGVALPRPRPFSRPVGAWRLRFSRSFPLRELNKTFCFIKRKRLASLAVAPWYALCLRGGGFTAPLRWARPAPSPLSAPLCTARPTVQTSALCARRTAGRPYGLLLIATGSFAKKKGSPQRKAFFNRYFSSFEVRYATTRNTAPQSSRSLV
jgi:hypothetical protein